MKSPCLTALLALACSAVNANPTLVCEANTRCDAYLKNCVSDPYSLSVVVNPKNNSVTLGNRQIEADFSVPDEVSFVVTKYTVRLNRNEYSAVLTADGEVRYGRCKRIEPAW